MTDYIRHLLLFLAAVNAPAAVLATRGLPGERSKGVAAIGLGTAGAILVLAAALAEPLLNLLDIAPETFRIAAGIVLAPVGIAALLRPGGGEAPLEESWRAGIAPVGLPLLAGPAALAVAISLGADDGFGVTVAAFVPALIVAALGVAWRGRGWSAGLDAAARLLGALLVALAAGLVVDGVRAV